MAQALNMNQISAPEFAKSPVPIDVARVVLGMSAQQVRNLMAEGALPIGMIRTAPKKRGKRSYRVAYISPLKFWMETGYIWDDAAAAEYEIKKQA